MATVRHKLTEVDRDGKTAVCSICGPVSIWVSAKGVDCAEKRKAIKLRSYRKSHPVEREFLTEEQRKERRHQYYLRNRDHLAKGYAARYREKRSEITEYNRRYYQDNADTCREAARRWARENPERRDVHQARRRTRLEDGMTAVDVKMSAEYRKQIANDPCYYCGEFAEVMQDDHLIPLARGGTDHWFNLVRACQFCNASKKDKMPGEFLARLRAG